MEERFIKENLRVKYQVYNSKKIMNLFFLLKIKKLLLFRLMRKNTTILWIHYHSYHMKKI